MNKMSEKDYAISNVGLPQVGKVSAKPRYLISLLDPTAKSKALTYFIAIDKPDLQLGFIAVKGIYVEGSEEEIMSHFSETVNNTPKEQILDLMLPNHRVHCIRSLVFNANKPSTLIKNG